MTRPGRAVVRDFGDRGLLVEPGEPLTAEVGFPTPWVIAVARQLSDRWPDACVVPGLSSVLLAVDDPRQRPSRDAVVRALEGAAGGRERGDRVPGERSAGEHEQPAWPGERHRTAVHTVAVHYDGPDLADVAAGVGLAPGELVARHTAAAWTVAAVGFSPGFGYLTCPDPLFAGVPRLDDPRPRVPAGSVALAAGMCAVYPSATPGGWRLIGRTPATLFDVQGERPARLSAGDEVRFVAEG